MRDGIELIAAALQDLEKGVPAIELDGKLLFTATGILTEMVIELGMITDYLSAILTAIGEVEQKPR